MRLGDRGPLVVDGDDGQVGGFGELVLQALQLVDIDQVRDADLFGEIPIHLTTLVRGHDVRHPASEWSAGEAHRQRTRPDRASHASRRTDRVTVQLAFHWALQDLSLIHI